MGKMGLNFLGALLLLGLPLLATSAKNSGAAPRVSPKVRKVTFTSAGTLNEVLIHNVMGGEIRGSRDGGKSWQLLGHVTLPIYGQYWLPTVEDQVLAFNYLRGPSNVFATAVNAVHLRFSDPPGYQLPTDIQAPLISPHGMSILPLEESGGVDTDPGVKHSILTDIPAGTLLFGREFTPRVGSQVWMGMVYNLNPFPMKRVRMRMIRSEPIF